MSDFKSTKEIYEYLLSGGKIKYGPTGEIVYLKESGELSDTFYFSYLAYWSKHIEPKPKVKMWQYAFYDYGGSKTWCAFSRFFKSDEDFKENYPTIKKFQRIENSMIEVDDE